jgi:hypothetical protein
MPRTRHDPVEGIDPDELALMIEEMGEELGCPHDVSPEYVNLDADPKVEGAGFNPGCVRNGVVLYREGQLWRRKILTELRRSPEWIAAWYAAREMDERVKQLCQQKGLHFGPHECPPWWVRADEELPPTTTPWAETAILAQRLRRELEAELAAETPAA